MRDLPVLYPKVQDALGKWKVWVPGQTGIPNRRYKRKGTITYSSNPDAILQVLLSNFQI